MKVFVALLGMSMLLLSCSGRDRIAEMNAVCAGLQAPIDNLGNTVLDNATQTPGPVVIAVATVAKAYDAGCV